MHIPFVDLTREHAELRQDFHDGLDAVLDGDGLVLGHSVAKFEKSFASLCDCRLAVGVGSGADALEIGLRALNLKSDDEVIVPANSFFASASAVCCAGAVPVFCDVDDFGLMTAKSVAAVATPRTRVVIPVHLYGQCVDMDPLVRWAQEHSVSVIEDACQAHGAQYLGRNAGSLGDLAAFSFYPTKNLGALGDGGAITTNNEYLGAQVKLWRNYGSTQKYIHTLPGRNSRLDTLQAHFLSIKLNGLSKALDRRRIVAKKYLKELSDLPLELPHPRVGNEHVYHLFVVRAESRLVRDALQVHLNHHGVSTLVHYPAPIHLQEAFDSRKHGPLPVAERWAETALSLPLYPSMTPKETNWVATAVRSYFGF